jgi:DNA polymerase-3 subunit epsilon
MSYERIVDPGVPITNSDIHGITDLAVAANGTPEVEAISELVWFLRAMDSVGVPVVAYNAAFDMSFARAVARRHQESWDLQGLHVIDPFVIDKHLDKWRKGSRQQAATARHYRVDVDATQLHSAMYDADLAVRIARVIGSKYPEIRMATDDFDRLQQGWAIEQQRGLQKYFNDSGKTNPDGSPIEVSIGFPYRDQKGSE